MKKKRKILSPLRFFKNSYIWSSVGNYKLNDFDKKNWNNMFAASNSNDGFSNYQDLQIKPHDPL